MRRDGNALDARAISPPPEVRLKAIEIANAMLAEGYDDGRAIRMAIAAAKKWAFGASYRRSAERSDADALPQRAAVAANAPRRGR